MNEREQKAFLVAEYFKQQLPKGKGKGMGQYGGRYVMQGAKEFDGMWYREKMLVKLPAPARGQHRYLAIGENFAEVVNGLPSKVARRVDAILAQGAF